MCGIVGYIGHRKASTVLLEGLKKLEYRGYDSAGIALKNDDGLHLYRSEGKLQRLVDKLNGNHDHAHIGIGHTRWATHGKPSEKNAHPHRAGRVTLVHNGIIENYQELKNHLPQKGAELKSETDTEVISHLLNANLKKAPSFLEAIRMTTKMLEGSYALVILDEECDHKLYVVKKGSPLVIGVGKNENIVASDIPGVLSFTNHVIFLENGEIGICEKNDLTFYEKDHTIIHKKPKKINWTAEMAEKGGYKHFMLKEIMEQPKAVHDTLLGRFDKDHAHIALKDLDALFKGEKFPPFNRLYIVACGTSWHAAMAGRYYLEAIAKVPVSVDTASEFRYREPFIDRKTLLLVISQSGETADTLACVEDACQKGANVMSICNVVESSIPRKCQATLYTQAGPEIGVASTKAFTTQLTLLLLIALNFGRHNKSLDSTYIKKAIKALDELPDLLENVLDRKDEIYKIAERYHACHDFYFIARGIHYPIALEGALKLKEISYIHAEGYSAGEMKHGPIALIEPGTPVVALAPQDRVCEKMLSNIQEVQARGASVITIATEGDHRFDHHQGPVFYVPQSKWYLSPILISIPLQLLAYYIADLRGTDVDQPRNLAKSVTVE
jgi:glucosamine--fructose-6-phosphate aminotransferase (isomerizing)